MGYNERRTLESLGELPPIVNWEQIKAYFRIVYLLGKLTIIVYNAIYMQNVSEKYIEELREFYDAKKISAGDKFNCEKLDECSSFEIRNLIHGAEAYVGPRYGDHIRLVLISLDTGGGSVNADKGYGENLEERRKRFSWQGRKNPHAVGTNRILELIYSELKNRDLISQSDYNKFNDFYAMINSSKCSAKAKTQISLSKSVNSKLYSNCSEFALRELEILDPDIIVTQGKDSKNVLSLNKYSKPLPNGLLKKLIGDTGRQQVEHHLNKIINEFIFITTICDKKVPTLCTPHPASRALWHMFKNFILPLCCSMVISLHIFYTDQVE